jgi:hypothetical protein
MLKLLGCVDLEKLCSYRMQISKESESTDQKIGHNVFLKFGEESFTY